MADKAQKDLDRMRLEKSLKGAMASRKAAEKKFAKKKEEEDVELPEKEREGMPKDASKYLESLKKKGAPRSKKD